MMASTVKNGNDRLRKGNRPRRHLFQRITLMNVDTQLLGNITEKVTSIEQICTNNLTS